MATPHSSSKQLPDRLRHERRRQLRGLILLAFAVLLFCIVRAGLSHVFPANWWKLW